ncbi:MAG TPA: 30S ribosomal protein S4 [Firmicutes bacterium]|nr:30S ribosomal protein S4 [Bacillota bacterium]
MANYNGPVCRLCRREGTKLFLKGERCYSDKCPVAKRPYPPGQHGQRRRGKVSDYGQQLREKQKARRIYGVMERQFRRYFKAANRAKGVTGERLLQLLELRLDNVVYRLGFADSRAQARQLVNHGHFSVNGRKVDIPSYSVRDNDEIAVRESSRNSDYFKNLGEVLGERRVPEWLTLDVANMAGRVVRLPERDEIDIPVQEHHIVEMYSR